MECLGGIVGDHLGQKIARAERFRVGLSHYVFDIATENGECCVVRIAKPSRKHELEGGLYWQKKLEQIGIPLPGVIGTGEVGGHAFAVYERLRGTDLEEVYPALSEQHKNEIACCVADIQQRVHTLPQASGYGHSNSYNDPCLKKFRKWPDVLYAILDRTEREILDNGRCDSRYVELTRARVRRYENYLTTVKPNAFLYDTNIKNVIVHNGAMSGIIDVDEVTFGDPFLSIGFAKTYLLLTENDTNFIDYWCEYLNCSTFQMEMVDLYALLYSVRFMGTLGQELNGNPSSIVDPENVDRLEEIADGLGCGK
jgi:aminoglycoside phosphotransferase (APT) family kinase protein